MVPANPTIAKELEGLHEMDKMDEDIRSFICDPVKTNIGDCELNFDLEELEELN